MTKKWMRAALIIPLLMMLPESVASTNCDKSKGQRLTITGTVVAYEQSALRLAQLTFVPRADRLIVRIEKRLKGSEESRYIKVLYTHLRDEAALPDGMFDGSKRWRFTLTRDRSCDDVLQDAVQLKDSQTGADTGVQLPHLQRTRGAEAEDILIGSSLPCYVLRPRDFRPAKGRK